MIPFYTRFPEIATRETRSIHVVAPGGPLPLGEYSYIELYCEELGCDCRRVVLEVVTPKAPYNPLAVINFGWESAEFYSRKLYGGARAGREITGASLDLINPQSKNADLFLDLFQKEIMTDPAYVARLARHYEMFKQDLRARPHLDTIAAPEEQSGDTTDSQAPISFKTPAEILQQLQRIKDQADFVPYAAALRAAAEQREAITPELIAAIDRVAAGPAHYAKDNEDCLHLFAIHLLAQFREPRAVDCFLRFFSLPGELALDLTGDLVTERGAVVLASVCGGDPAPLLKLIHGESVNEFVREQAIYALLVQAAWGQRSREAVVEDLRRLFHTLPKPGDSFVWAGLTGAVCDFPASELAPEARQAFADELVDETVLDLAWFERELLARGMKCVDEFSAGHAPIDAVDECSTWCCFRSDVADNDFLDKDKDIEEEDPGDKGWPASMPPQPSYEPPPKPVPFIAASKVGRNDPCPCGSGKKFKKCCGKTDLRSSTQKLHTGRTT